MKINIEFNLNGRIFKGFILYEIISCKLYCTIHEYRSHIGTNKPKKQQDFVNNMFS